MRVGVLEAVGVMVGVSVLVFDGVSELVGMRVFEAVRLGIDVRVGVRETKAPKLAVPNDRILPSRYPMMVLTLAAPMATASVVLWGKSRTLWMALPTPQLTSEPSPRRATE